MNDEKLKNQIGANIAAYRKREGWTQAKLAEKLNYSDKAVSKWERGESVPDVLILANLAELYGIAVNDLLVDPNELPETAGAVQHAMGHMVEKTLKRKANKNTILQLSSLLVWFVALLIFVVLDTIGIPHSWLAFIYAIAADGIGMLSLRSAWKDFRWNRALVSIIMWGALLSVFMTLLILGGINVWRIFLLGVPGQAAILLWFRLFRQERGSEEKHG